jgi:hypothetical protein
MAQTEGARAETRRPPRCLLLVPVLAFAGCGPGAGTLTGKVSFQGQPVPAGQVTLLGPDGRAATGRIDSDGTYTIPGAPLGPVTILVDSRPSPSVVLPRSPQKAEARKKTGPGKAKLGPAPGSQQEGPRRVPPVARYVPIPTRYSDPEKSALTCVVRKGVQSYDINLKP